MQRYGGFHGWIVSIRFHLHIENVDGLNRQSHHSWAVGAIGVVMQSTSLWYWLVILIRVFHYCTANTRPLFGLWINNTFVSCEYAKRNHWIAAISTLVFLLVCFFAVLFFFLSELMYISSLLCFIFRFCFLLLFFAMRIYLQRSMHFRFSYEWK